MKLPTVFILAGGLGTRLAHVVSDVPKPMASVSEKPFLEWQILWLARQDFNDIVLLVGYKSEVIRDFFGDGRKFGVKIRYSLEKDLLGTGGAVLQALERFPAEECVILNGDTFFDVPLGWIVEYRRSSLPRDCALMALKYSSDTRRYGNVSIGPTFIVNAFHEKADSQGEGYINGGIYVAGLETFRKIHAKKESMENDVFPELVAENKLYGVPFGGRFIDIGVEDDYRLADTWISDWYHQKKKPALFLDRDGILIQDTGYVKDPHTLIFYEEFFRIARMVQDRGFLIVVISNQAGVAKGYLSPKDVEKVNAGIQNKFESNGVRLSGIYWCPYHENGTVPEWTRFSLSRKPEPGMILKAVEDHHIDAFASLMVGDKDSDRINLPYLKTVIIPGRYPVEDKGDIIDIEGIGDILGLGDS